MTRAASSAASCGPRGAHWRWRSTAAARRRWSSTARVDQPARPTAIERAVANHLGDQVRRAARGRARRPRSASTTSFDCGTDRAVASTAPPSRSTTAACRPPTATDGSTTSRTSRRGSRASPCGKTGYKTKTQCQTGRRRGIQTYNSVACSSRAATRPDAGVPDGGTTPTTRPRPIDGGPRPDGGTTSPATRRRLLRCRARSAADLLLVCWSRWFLVRRRGTNGVG